MMPDRVVRPIQFAANRLGVAVTHQAKFPLGQPSMQITPPCRKKREMRNVKALDLTFITREPDDLADRGLLKQMRAP